MSRRKGEITPHQIDRDYPPQVDSSPAAALQNASPGRLRRRAPAGADRVYLKSISLEPVGIVRPLVRP
jgi:hypothetical protein